MPASDPGPLAEIAAARTSLPRHAWLRALGVVLLCTAVSALFESYFDPANLIMVYLAGVVYVALRLGRAAALLATVASIVVFDFIYVPPRWGFHPIDPQYYFTFVVMLAVGLLISGLAARAREQALVANARAARAQALNQLALQLASARSQDAIAQALVRAVHASFAMPCVLLLPDAAGVLQDPASFCAGELSIAQRVLDGAEPAGAAAADGGGLYLPLQGPGAALGVLAVRPPAARWGTPEDRRLLDAFANQAALALDRALFEHRSAQAGIEAETERLRSTLLSGISHDFRTPLTTIVGAVTSLLQQDQALDQAHRTMLLESVLSEAQRMHALMSDLLDLTRMEEGGVLPHCEWCPADDLIAEVREALGTRLARHTLRVQVPADAIVWCDPRLLEQVLVNLLDNAVRHTQPGSTIEVRVEVDATTWRLTVADDGPGLPAGQETEVFKKFFRGRHEPADGGTGLGLAICAAVARLHRGGIEAHNAAGACFTLTLPQPATPAGLVAEAA